MNLTTFPTLPVLLVDDEAQFLSSVSLSLNSEGINNVVQCQDSRDVMSKLSEQDFSVVMLDMRDAPPIGGGAAPDDCQRVPRSPDDYHHGGQ